MMDKVVAEEKKLYEEITFIAKVIKEKVKSK